MSQAQKRWADDLAAWAIPEDILRRAPESPWGFPVSLFAIEPADMRVDTPSHRRAWEALPPGGSVLDVGAGGGASSLALGPRAACITAVDQSAELLESFAATAEQLSVDHREVLGTWPEVASAVGTHDVVVSHHVFYNVPNLAPFIGALTAAARGRVVIEMTATHPGVSLNELWRHFHGIDRPTGPTYEDALAVLRELGVAASVETWDRPGRRATAPRRELVAFARRRLCLPKERDPEIDALLDERSVWSPSHLATIWWPGEAARP